MSWSLCERCRCRGTSWLSLAIHAWHFAQASQSGRTRNSLPEHGSSWRGKTIHYHALSHDWTAGVHVSVMCDVTFVWRVVTRLPLGPPVIVVSPESASVNMSQNALLRCQAVADPPNMTYVWLKDGENVYHVEWVHSLLFAPEWSILTLCLIETHPLFISLLRASGSKAALFP